MEFDYYVWNYIKMFIFPQHLWNTHYHKKFNEVLKHIKKPVRFGGNFLPCVLISSIHNTDKFMKIYESVSWYTPKNITNLLVSHVYIPRNITVRNYAIETLNLLTRFDVIPASRNIINEINIEIEDDDTN